MRNGCRFEQRNHSVLDEDGNECEWVEHLAFCLAHRQLSEECVRPNSKSGIRKKKANQNARAPLTCPICKACRTVRVKHPLLGLARNYELSKETNRLREESKMGEAVESEDDEPTQSRAKKPRQPLPSPPADSIAVQRGRRSKKHKQHSGSEDGEEQHHAVNEQATSADEMPLDDVDDSALVSTSAASSSSSSSPSSSPSLSLPTATFPLSVARALRQNRSPFVVDADPSPSSCLRPRVHYATFSRHWDALDHYRRLYASSGLSEHRAHAADSTAELEAWLPCFKLTEMRDVFDAHGWSIDKSKVSVTKLRHELKLWIRRAVLREPAELIDKFMAVAQSEQDGEDKHKYAETAADVEMEDESLADENGDGPETVVSTTHSPETSLLVTRSIRPSSARLSSEADAITPTKHGASPAATTSARPRDSSPSADKSPLSYGQGRLTTTTSPLPRLVAFPTELCKLTDTSSPRQAKKRAGWLADERLCQALHDMSSASGWDAVAIHRKYQPEEIEALVTLHGYSCQLNGQPAPPKTILRKLVQLIHGRMILTADELRAQDQAAYHDRRQARQEAEAIEQISVDSDSGSDSDYTMAGRTRKTTKQKKRRRRKRRADDSLLRRRDEQQSKKKRQRESAGSERKEEETKEDGADSGEMEETTREQTAVLVQPMDEETVSGEVGEADVLLRSVAVVLPPVLPRIGTAGDGSDAVTVDPPATVRRRGSVLSPTSATSSKSNIPSSQSTFPSSQSSGAVTVQRAISFSSAEPANQSTPPTPSVSSSSSSAALSAASSASASSSASSRLSKSLRALLSSLAASPGRIERLAGQRDVEALKLVTGEVELLREVLDGILEEFPKRFVDG